MRLGAVIVLSLSAFACHDAIDLGVRAVANEKVREDLFVRPSLLVELEPEPPPNLHAGESAFLEVRAVFPSGEVCRHCEAAWSSAAPEVAAFSEPRPRCAGGRCVLLEGVGPGTADLSVRVCKSYERDCVRKEFKVRVVR